LIITSSMNSLPLRGHLLFVYTKDLPAPWIDKMNFEARGAMFSLISLPCYFSVGAGVFDPAFHLKIGIRELSRLMLK
jgi:hypothetical protein